MTQIDLSSSLKPVLSLLSVYSVLVLYTFGFHVVAVRT